MIWKKLGALLLVCGMLLCALPVSASVSAAENDPASQTEALLPLVGGALVEAGQRQWSKAEADIRQFEAQWTELKAPASGTAQEVNAALTASKQALAKAETDPEAAVQAVSALTKALNKHLLALEGEQKNKLTGKDAARSLLPALEQTLQDIEQGDAAKARSSYRTIVRQWTQVESPIRGDDFAAYGDMEMHMSLVRAALQAEPPKTEQAADEMRAWLRLTRDYAEGKLQSASSGTERAGIADLVAVLKQTLKETQARQASAAGGHLRDFVSMWPSAEGEVQLRSPQLYTEIENRMTEGMALLTSNPPDWAKAEALLGSLIAGLEPLAQQTRYTAWDAALILLREGMEALLVLTALLALLGRTGGAGRAFVWGGAAAGLAASAGLALLLTHAVAEAASGSARELIEGIAGLAAVVFMLSVGAWLHSKSNVKAWEAFIRQKVSGALARGSLLSLSIVAFLAVLREGAETAVFYMGMAPAIEASQMALGIGGALAALAALGYAMIRFSIRLPVRPFFLTATALIYYLVIRFLGESVHALQVAGAASAHPVGFVPTIGWLGVYPTWETLLPQLAALLLVLLLSLRTESKRASADSPAP